MIAVVDTNVIVSGLLRAGGPPGEVVKMVASGALELCYDARVLLEYSQVLARPKFRLEPDHLNMFLDQVEHNGHLVATTTLRSELPDEDDRPFAEVAQASGATYLVTGNKRHFPAKRYGTAEVVTPAEFIQRIRSG